MIEDKSKIMSPDVAILKQTPMTSRNATVFEQQVSGEAIISHPRLPIHAEIQ